MTYLQPSFQRTLRNTVSCTGIGLHSGLHISMTLIPAEADTGIRFRRTDIKDQNPVVKANYLNVTNTMLGTTVSNEDGIKIGTIEHLMAALWGCGIDNCLIELSGPEIPIMDGSSEPFVFLIECAGIIEQAKTRTIIEVLKSVDISEGDCHASIHPGDSFSISLEIDFKDRVIANQKSMFDASNLSFKSDLCRARTFGFDHEVNKLRELGLARGGSLENAIVVGEDGVLNEEGLRYDDEFVRHKILDCIGDVYLAGAHLKGHFKGFKSGHGLNNKLLHKFFADKSAWRALQLPANEAVATLN